MLVCISNVKLQNRCRFTDFDSYCNIAYKFQEVGNTNTYLKQT